MRAAAEVLQRCWADVVGWGWRGDNKWSGGSGKGGDDNGGGATTLSGWRRRKWKGCWRGMMQCWWGISCREGDGAGRCPVAFLGQESGDRHAVALSGWRWWGGVGGAATSAKVGGGSGARLALGSGHKTLSSKSYIKEL